MVRKLSLAMALVGAFALSAVAAETIAPKADVADPAADTAMVPVVKGVDTPAVPTAAVETPAATGSFAFTAAQDKAWLDKSVYSSDGKNVGEIVSFQRDKENMVIGLHADIGGFLGMGETRVAVTSAQFKLVGDRAVLSLTAAQAKVLPKAAI